LEVLRTYGEGFAGREAELAALDNAWNEGTVRVFVLHAEGGAGKTRVVAKWLTEVRDDGWRGAQRVFVHSFYSQGSASSELFFEQALAHFGRTGPRPTDPTEQGRTLARLLIEQNGLMVLDGIEPLQHPPSFDQGRLKDPAIGSLLLSLSAGRMSDSADGGLCVVTSRQPVVELKSRTGRTVIQQPLDRLDAAAGAALLQQLEVRGPEQELREAVDEAHGHAYSLMLLGTYLRNATDDHEIRRRHEIPLLDEDENAEHRYHARHMFEAYVRHLGEESPEVTVLRLLGFFDRPAEEKLLAVLRESDEPGLNALSAPLRKLSSVDSRRVLRRLNDLRLIDLPIAPAPPIDSHPLLREYFAEQLRTHLPEAWRAGHRRLFEHLCRTTEHRPNTLIGLQPLYQAVAHGCLAGLHQQALSAVYIDRIQRGGKFYSTRQLGSIAADLRAMEGFFITPWTRLASTVPPAVQAWLLNETSFRLKALGRLTEAVESIRLGLERLVADKNWREAAVSGSILCDLEITRGEIQAAVIAGEQSVAHADRVRDPFQKISRRATLADALNQAGRRIEARRLFEEAEALQGELQPRFPLLYSQAGFQYYELLLSEADRATWRCCLDLQFDPNGETHLSQNRSATFGASVVIERASQILDWNKLNESPLIDFARTRLILARAMFYKAYPATSTIPQAAFEYSESALTGLRDSHHIDKVPHGLLTRAWLHFLSGDKQGCRGDLDEAWEIAERGPMPLFQADILLYRARLFHDRAALAEARRLIEKHGYHRRDEELADAEAAAQRWGEKAPERQKPTTADKDSMMTTSTRRFRIALSFSGEHRPFVEQVAAYLSAAIGREEVLFDKYYEAEFARINLDTYLQRLYHDESDLIAVFLSADYERKEWCGLEWRALRDLIKRRQAHSVMHLRFDNTEIPGLFSTDGYIWIGDRSPADIANRILERWRFNAGQPAP
jgi:hypothetical protein